MFKSLVHAGLAAVAAVFLSMAFPSAGHAVSYDLTDCHFSSGCGPAGTIYGTVTLVQNGSTVDVTVHINDPYVWAKTGAVDFQAFKFNGTDIVLADITVDQTWAGQTLIADAGTFDGDGTGLFGFGIACSTCGNGISTIDSDIVFHVANATIADLTGLNNLGIMFVADLGNSLTGLTGPVAVPGPLLGAGIPGLIAACLALFGLSRRRRKLVTA